MKWKHFPQIFQRIFQMKARPEMDLFASRLLAQLPWYIAWYIAQYITLCFLTFFNKKQGFEKNSSGLSKNNVDCGSHMAVSIVAPKPSENVNRQTTSLIISPASSIEAPGSDTYV